TRSEVGGDLLPHRNTQTTFDQPALRRPRIGQSRWLGSGRDTFWGDCSVLGLKRSFTLTAVVTVCAIAYTASAPGAGAAVHRNIEAVKSVIDTLQHGAPASSTAFKAR